MRLNVIKEQTILCIDNHKNDAFYSLNKTYYFENFDQNHRVLDLVKIKIFQKKRKIN